MAPHAMPPPRPRTKHVPRIKLRRGDTRGRFPLEDPPHDRVDLWHALSRRQEDVAGVSRHGVALAVETQHLYREPRDGGAIPGRECVPVHADGETSAGK